MGRGADKNSCFEHKAYEYDLEMPWIFGILLASAMV